MTETLRRASGDMLHFAVVFGTVFLLYAIASMILFGQELENFANFGRATQTTFQALLEDPDHEELTRTGRFRAEFWYWTLTWVVTLVMLNMLLALIMDAYTDVKSSIDEDAETLGSQLLEVVQRWAAV